MTHERITYNEPDNWTGADDALGLVDEIVLRNVTIHLEMLDDATAHLHMWRPGRDVAADIYATGHGMLRIRLDRDDETPTPTRTDPDEENR